MYNRLILIPEQTSLSCDSIVEGPSPATRDDHGLSEREFDKWLATETDNGRFDVYLTPFEEAEMFGAYWHDHAGANFPTM